MEKYFSKDAHDFMIAHSWEGNVRELENTVERAVVLSAATEINSKDLDGYAKRNFNVESLFEKMCEKEGRLLSLQEMNQLYIEYALAHNCGAREKTAKDLGIDRKTLYRKTHHPLV